jgi:hypothetical protein
VFDDFVQRSKVVFIEGLESELAHGWPLLHVILFVESLWNLCCLLLFETKIRTCEECLDSGAALNRKEVIEVVVGLLHVILSGWLHVGNKTSSCGFILLFHGL